MMHILTIYWRQ